MGSPAMAARILCREGDEVVEGDACRQQTFVAAGFWHRGMAFVIDSALLLSLHCIFFLVLGHALTGLAPAGFGAVLAAAVLFLLLFLFTPVLMVLAYSVVLHACGGQTVGKLIMGIRLVSADGTPISAGVSFLRWVASILSFLPFGLGFLWAAVSRNRITWHDNLAGTMVISTEQTS